MNNSDKKGILKMKCNVCNIEFKDLIRHLKNSNKCQSDYDVELLRKEQMLKRLENKRSLYHNNKQIVLEKRKLHYDKNKEEILEKRKIHYKNNRKEIRMKQAEAYKKKK